MLLCFCHGGNEACSVSVMSDVRRTFHMSESKIFMSPGFPSPHGYTFTMGLRLAPPWVPEIPLIEMPVFGPSILSLSLLGPYRPLLETLYGTLPLELPLNPLLGPSHGPFYPSLLTTLMDIIRIWGM